MSQDEMIVEKPKVFCLGKIVPIGKVKPNPANPNVHPDDQVRMLAEILKVNGWREAIIVSNRSGMVVKGHGRLQTAKFMKLDEVPVEYQDYDDEQAELADMIADNRVAQHSYVDAFKLGSLLKKINEKGQGSLGYTQEEINLYLSAEYVAPEMTDRKFIVLETLKLTKEAKAIISGAVQKFCLKVGKEMDWGEVLAQICMSWQIVVLPTMAQAEAPKPISKEAKVEKKPKKEAPLAASVAIGPGSVEITVKYAAKTWLDDKQVSIVRADDGARYYTTDEETIIAAAALKGKKVAIEFVMNGGVAWIESLEAA